MEDIIDFYLFPHLPWYLESHFHGEFIKIQIIPNKCTIKTVALIAWILCQKDLEMVIKDYQEVEKCLGTWELRIVQ